MKNPDLHRRYQKARDEVLNQGVLPLNACSNHMISFANYAEFFVAEFTEENKLLHDDVNSLLDKANKLNAQLKASLQKEKALTSENWKIQHEIIEYKNKSIYAKAKAKKWKRRAKKLHYLLDRSNSLLVKIKNVLVTSPDRMNQGVSNSIADKIISAIKEIIKRNPKPKSR